MDKLLTSTGLTLSVNIRLLTGTHGVALTLGMLRHFVFSANRRARKPRKKSYRHEPPQPTACDWNHCAGYASRLPMPDAEDRGRI